MVDNVVFLLKMNGGGDNMDSMKLGDSTYRYICEIKLEKDKLG